MSAEKCPVCGCVDRLPFNGCDCHVQTIGLACGYGVDGVGCNNAERLAIERAAEIERVKSEKAELLALCLRLSALPGDYNAIQDAEFVFRDINNALAKIEAGT